MGTYGDRILALIQETDGHLSAEEIYLQLKQSQPKMVLATVYNNLKKLSQAGLVRRVSVEGFPDRYDRVTRHDHLLCTVCGQLSDVLLPDLTDTLRHQTGVQVHSYDLKINYTCADCQARQGATSSH